MTQSQFEQVTEVHTSRNTYPFVLRFPTEILENISIHCASDCYYEHQDCINPTVPCRVEISYVCRHWRNVVLACPTFWTYGFITSQRWTEEFLARSKQASLRICANFLLLQNPSHWLIPLEKVIDHVERIQELRLKLPGSCASRVVSRLFSRAPRLQNLEIMIEDQESLQWPSLLFGGSSPALRTLELSGCPALLQSFNLDKLTTLDLDDVPRRFRPGMEEFLSSLRGLQVLKHLYLNGAIASGLRPGAVFGTSKKIDLPQLSRLSITAPLSTVVTFFSCINIPLEAQVMLGCERDHHSPTKSYRILNSLLAERYRIPKDQIVSTPTILSLCITCSRWLSATFSISAYGCDHTHVSQDDWDSHIPLEINLESYGVDDDLINLLYSIPLSNVQRLDVNDPPSSRAFWRNMLGHLQGVRYIKLGWGSMPDLSALSESPIHITGNDGEQKQGAPAVGDQSQSPMFAPQLEELVLEGIEFAQEDGSDLPSPVITHQRLFDILSNRKGSRGRLFMTECEFGGSRADFVMVWGDSGGALNEFGVAHDGGKERERGTLEGEGEGNLSRAESDMGDLEHSSD